MQDTGRGGEDGRSQKREAESQDAGQKAKVKGQKAKWGHRRGIGKGQVKGEKPNLRMQVKRQRSKGRRQSGGTGEESAKAKGQKARWRAQGRSRQWLGQEREA